VNNNASSYSQACVGFDIVNHSNLIFITINTMQDQWRAEVWWCPGGCLVVCPLPNSSIEQWRMVVIVAGYTLFATSQRYVIFTFANQPYGEVCW